MAMNKIGRCNLCSYVTNLCEENENILKMLKEVFLDRFTFTKGICCNSCLIKLQQSHQFVIMVEKSQLKLSTILDCIQEHSIKNEPLTIIDDHSLKPELINNDNITIAEEQPPVLFETEFVDVSRPQTENESVFNDVIESDKDPKQISISDLNINNNRKINKKPPEQQKISETNSACNITTKSPIQNTESEIFDCTKCNNSFFSLPLLKNHITSIHKEFVCNSCNSIFISKYLYDLHLKKSFCNIDQNTTNTSSDINENSANNNIQEETSSKATESNVCWICGKIYNTTDSIFRRHVRDHTKPKQQCDKCGKFSHKKICPCKNSRDRKFPCNICGKHFFSRAAVCKHVKTKHMNSFSKPCTVCKKRFYDDCALKVHMRQHTDERPFNCDVCGAAYRHKVSLRSHQKLKHGIVEDITCHCEKCGKGFINDDALRGHLKVHT